MAPRKNAKKAFSLIEIVIALLIMVIMTAVTTSLFLTATADAKVKQCRSDMMTIGNLEQEHRIKDPNHAYTTSIATLMSETPTVPVCPSSGTYTITLSDGSMTAQNGQVVPVGKVIISCSVSGHGKYAPDIDSN